jgi:uncharacterized damage-inducible protein DinB
MAKTLGQIFLNELNMEVKASRKCLEVMRADLFNFKPHEKSMQMGYLAEMTADIPRWISTILEEGVVDFGTWEQKSAKTADELVKLLDENVAKLRPILENYPDEKMSEMFYLRHNGTDLSSDTKENSVSSTLNHWVHHRGQLTVYMRLNDIPVPALYGPSADDQSW